LPSSRKIEGRKRSDRPALEKALAAARVRQAPLVVAKVDRLTRSVAFLSRLLEARVDVRFADFPMIEGATQIPSAANGRCCRRILYGHA
jgi:DNA invertase Pin-like site-specific DNA recombinase